MLQAYIDDSKANEDVLVLAGYVAPAAAWQDLSLEWQELLNEPPAWKEFKMHRVGTRKHRSRGERFYRVVEKHALVSLVCVVEIEPLRRIRTELALPLYFDNPYVFAIRAILDATAQSLRAPISFVFDERGEGKFVEKGWEGWRKSVPDLHDRLPAQPTFRRSEEVLPLQSAEIIAWHARRHWLKHHTITGDVDISWEVQRRVPCHAVSWNAEAIRPNFIALRDRLLSWGLL